MNILLVEPDRVLARTYTQALEQAGHSTAQANTAQTAIFAVDEQQPDLIFLEMQLVGHGGVEFLYELRSYPEWQTIPVVALSLTPPGEFKDSWQLLQDQLGVQRYLYKPHTSLAKLLHIAEEFATLKV